MTESNDHTPEPLGEEVATPEAGTDGERIFGKSGVVVARRGVFIATLNTNRSELSGRMWRSRVITGWSLIIANQLTGATLYEIPYRDDNPDHSTEQRNAALERWAEKEGRRACRRHDWQSLIYQGGPLSGALGGALSGGLILIAERIIEQGWPG